MEPITTAIVAAIAAGVAAGATDVAKQAIVDAYNGIKQLIARKFGPQSDVAAAIEGLEKRPDSEARKATLQEEVALAKANDDPEIVQAAAKLIDLLKQTAGGEKLVQTVQTATGSNIAQAASGSTATVTVGTPKND